MQRIVTHLPVPVDGRRVLPLPSGCDHAANQFIVRAIAGNQIWVAGTNAPEWARTGHRYGAATIAGVFTVNTITGLWNLWDSRHVEPGRALRVMHATSMLVADAGFTWAGAKLSEQAERDMSKRRLHRTVAMTSMGITLTSGLLMKFLNR